MPVRCDARAGAGAVLGRFMGLVGAGHLFETYDEGEIISEVGRRLEAGDVEEKEVYRWAADLLGKVIVISKAFGVVEAGRPRKLQACRIWSWTPARSKV